MKRSFQLAPSTPKALALLLGVLAFLAVCQIYVVAHAPAGFHSVQGQLPYYQSFPVSFSRSIAPWLSLLGLELLAGLSWALGGWIGGVLLGALCLFALLDVYLSHLVGTYNDDVVIAIASSGLAHLYLLPLALAFLGVIVFALAVRRLMPFRPRLAVLFALAALCLGLGREQLFEHSAYPRFSWQVGPLPTLNFRTWPIFGVGWYERPNVWHTAREFTWRQPNVLASFAQMSRRAFPGLPGDMLSLVLTSADPGFSALPPGGHEMPDFIKNRDKNHDKNHDPSKAETIVVVIGEASLARRYGLYGASAATTPKLGKLADSGKICVLPKVHSVANQTRWAVLPYISAFSPHDVNAALTKKNLLELAENQGFRTYWLTVQGESGLYAGSIGYVARHADFYAGPAMRTHESARLPGTAALHVTNADDSLLPFFDAALDNDAPKKFIVVHIWGSHMPYALRSDENDREALKGADSYDLSIHHTDRIVSALYEKLAARKKPFVFFYGADHGEEVGVGHSLQTGTDDYLVPMLAGGGHACQDLEALREDDGWMSTDISKFFLAETLGYTLAPVSVRKEKADDFVYHVDGKLYRWPALPQRTP